MRAKTGKTAGALWIGTCLVLSSAAPIAAAEPSAASEAAEAKVAALVEQGIELRRMEKDAQALLVFEAALERAPRSARVRVHVATTHQALGQWLEAERYLRELLSETDDPYVLRHRAALEKAQAFVARHVGSLEVTGEPAGAEVWLSGRRLGTLPLSETVRAPIGSYVLEVRSAGHYPVSRPITLVGGGLRREAVSLAPSQSSALALTASNDSVREPVAGPGWLTWTFAGLGAGAAITSGIAFAMREKHADRWNGDECLAPQRTRGDVCPDELDAGKTAEKVAITSGVVSGLFLGAALTSYLLGARDEETSSALRCDLGWASAGCSGTF